MKSGVDNQAHMLKKLLAKIGIGAASVRTELPATSVALGETVTAEVHAEGGDVEQEFKYVELEFETRYSTDEGYQDATVGKATVSEGTTIEPGEERSWTVDLEVPYDAPLTYGRSKVWLETDLEIPLSLDPSHTINLEVEPDPLAGALFDALDDLGFVLRSADCEAASFRHGQRFVQEFEFTPDTGEYSSDLDELEFVLDPGPDALDVHLEVDKRGGMLSEMTDMDESKTSITVTEADADSVAEDLRAAIDAEL